MVGNCLQVRAMSFLSIDGFCHLSILTHQLLDPMFYTTDANEDPSEQPMRKVVENETHETTPHVRMPAHRPGNECGECAIKPSAYSPEHYYLSAPVLETKNPSQYDEGYRAPYEYVERETHSAYLTDSRVIFEIVTFSPNF